MTALRGTVALVTGASSGIGDATRRHVRMSLVEPGAVDTELATHVREEVQPALRQRFAGMERLEAEGIADAIVYVATRPRRVAINEVLIRPTEQQGQAL